jgi:hypothetical protein
MYYVTCRCHQMEKRKFGTMCPGALFLDTALGPPEHEKWCIGVSHPGHIGMHYVTHGSYQMQKQLFRVTSPDALSMETAPGPPEHEK